MLISSVNSLVKKFGCFSQQFWFPRHRYLPRLVDPWSSLINPYFSCPSVSDWSREKRSYEVVSVDFSSTWAHMVPIWVSRTLTCRLEERLPWPLSPPLRETSPLDPRLLIGTYPDRVSCALLRHPWGSLSTLFDITLLSVRLNS